MNKLLSVVVLSGVIGMMTPVFADEPPAEQFQLNDGSVLFLHPDGTGRMVDEHGKAMKMSDGVAMETKDGRTIMMKNKQAWIRYSPTSTKEKTYSP